jgi:hypothetical protein
MTPSDIVEHIVTAIALTELDEDPMHHIEVHDFLPTETYNLLVDNMPPASWYKVLGPDSRKGASTRSLLAIGEDSPLHPVWRDVHDALAHPYLKEVLFRTFRGALTQRFGASIEKLFAMETALLVRLSRDTEGFHLAPHCDKPSKVVTLQLYLPPDATQRELGTSLYGQGASGLEEMKRMPFVPNFAYAFPMTKVGKPSWHGVERIGPIAYPRNSLVLGFHIHD